jgi:hypothetical protein
MKTNYIYQSLKVIAGLCVTLFLVNCGSNNGSSGSAAPAPASGYYQLVGSTCYMNSNGSMTATANTNCSGTGTYYYSSGSTCYLHASNGSATQVAATYCSTTGNNNSGPCQGLFTDGYQWVTCGTQFNCSGYTLMNQQGQIITCQ